MKPKDVRLLVLAQGQHHLISRNDVTTCGLSSQEWCDRVDEGAWLSVAERVFRHAASQLTWEMRVRGAAMSLGRNAAAYGATAAQWWGLDGFVGDQVEFVVPRARRSLDPSVQIHTTRQWDPGDLLSHRGVRVTSATRTIIDLAASRHSAATIENAIDSAIRFRLTTVVRLTSRLAELTPGRPGTRLLRELLLDSGGESFLERRFLRLVRSAHLPRPSCQVVHGSNGKVMRVDFEFRAANVVVEVSGRLGHTTDRDRQKDARRRNALQQEGKVLEFTTVDVMSAPEYVLRTLDISGVVTG
ncbi:MAG: hypothetical protein ABIZ69_07015 [Ilumatobacteraceae bacterium]